MPEVKMTEEAIIDRDSLDECEWELVRSKIKEVSGAFSHEDLKLISNPLLDHPVWQLKVEEEDLDYRAYLDVRAQEIVVLGIFDYDFTHQGDQHWKEIEERM